MPFTLPDSTGKPQNMSTTVDSAGNVVPVQAPAVGGNPVSTGNPLPVTDAGVGTTADTAYTTGSGSVVSVLKGIFGKVAGTLIVQDSAAETTLGQQGDAAWSGTGNSSVVAALKAIWTALTGTLSTKTASATPAAGTASAIVTGGTALAVITGPVRGAYIINPKTAADQGIATAEELYVDMVGTAGTVGNGTTAALDPGAQWTLPCPLPAGKTVTANAATAGHKLTVVVWN